MNFSLFFPFKRSLEIGTPRFVLLSFIVMIILFVYRIVFALRYYGKPEAFFEESPQILSSRMLFSVTVLLLTFSFMQLSNIKNYFEIQELAYLDELTETLNRRAILDFGNASVSNSKRSKIPFSILMLDVDHLKMINDTYGHRAGDQAIQLVAFTIKSNLRREDAIGRYGGDEFLIILRNNNLSGATHVAKRLIYQVEKQCAGGNYMFETVDISIGISQYSSPDQTLEELIDQADQALYKAKEFSGSSYHRAEISADWPKEFI
jgi:diguanylate cyclase (GGDEF)-like protein